MSADPADGTVRPSTIPPAVPTPTGDTESDPDFEVTLAAMCAWRDACRRLRHYRHSGGCVATCDIPGLLRVAFPAEADLPQPGRPRVDVTRGVELLWRAAHLPAGAEPRLPSLWSLPAFVGTVRSLDLSLGEAVRVWERTDGPRWVRALCDLWEAEDRRDARIFRR